MSKKMRHQFACSKMMLPEHRGSLERHREEVEQNEKYSRPILEEQEQERFQRALQQAIENGAPLSLSVLNKNGFRRLTGIVIKLEPWAGRLRLHTGASVETVFIAEVTGVEFGEQHP